jgi:hypothetical protein
MVEAQFSFQCSSIKSSGKRRGVNSKESWKVGMWMFGGGGGWEERRWMWPAVHVT